MSNRYARLPNPTDRHPHHDLDDEVEAAFDYREEDDDHDEPSESQPLNRNVSHPPPPPPRFPEPSANVPGTYNFEIADYDYPPPGSPPPLTAAAFPNDWGNSNGTVPDFDNNPVPQPRRPWWKRAASVLPASVASRLGVSSGSPSGLVGGGTNNDGVFANVTAKPTAPARVQNGDDTHIVPEDAQNEAPPSYAAAQADAVPPYWETTIHAPFAPESMGEMIVDSLPTGSLFSFCWNMLVSVSFQFVGFLLTYLLHTSHAARLGSRAGLGVTLIQYGFALRGKLDSMDGTESEWKPAPDAHPTFPSTPEADAWAQAHPVLSNRANATASTIPSPDDGAGPYLADATAEWLSFFLMTIGWFILLTSVLGYYRVKRWERSILATQRESPNSAAPTAATGAEDTFAIRGMSRIDFLRSGFGLSTRYNEEDEREAQLLARAEAADREPLDPNAPDYQERLQERIRDRRFVEGLRSAGLL
ncbi:hypothetical protein D9611_002389 [Ephemerocybe angulata]|uniref:Metal homeostatis protein bsd2 n=1 Tax=Ephemerocybe angulata TaxID=980116 RepID=A0A8H5C214_9AGAR|nr:hypothetical protein D9611_002389 [Tulosesus angulatus]